MNEVRFVHTADWQLGMRRWFLRERHSSFDDSRMAAVRRLLEAARENDASFVVVAGDVFDANSLDTAFVIRALRVMGEAEIPVYLLPGNHDMLEPGSVYRSTKFREYKPDNVHVLDSSGPVEVAPGVLLAGVPIESKYPAHVDLGSVVGAFSAAEGVDRARSRRILVLHGGTDAVYGGSEDDGPGIEFPVAELEALVSSGDVDYIALGDRHSATQVGQSSRVWYSGAPEVTAFDDVETDSGNALLVRLDENRCSVEKIRTGAWKLLRRDQELTSSADVEMLRTVLDRIEDKERTVVKLTLSGSLTLEDGERLDRLLEDYAGLFANVYLRKESSVIRRPSSLDLETAFSGYAHAAAVDLAEQANRGGTEGAIAEDALALLYSLSIQGGRK